MTHFTFQERVGNICRIATIEVEVDGARAGSFMLGENEWHLLRAMLLHGGGFFQEGEADIKISSEDKLHAYMEGINAPQES